MDRYLLDQPLEYRKIARQPSDTHSPIMAAPSSHSDTQEAANQVAACIACQTVFATAELAEQIIVHLPAKQLFTTQRVCKTFANAIAASPTIQVKMFKRLSDHPGSQTLESTNPSATGKQSAQPETSRELKLAATLQSRPVLSPWLAVVPQIQRRRCRTFKQVPKPAGVKVRLKWRRSSGGYFFATREDSYLDTYFCDTPSPTITVEQKYLVNGDALENTMSVYTDRPMTIREVLELALDQTGRITDSFSPKDELLSGSMGVAIKRHEHEKGCTDGSKTVLSNVEFILHGVFDLVGPEGERTETRELTLGTHLPNRKVASSQERANMAM